MAIGRTTCYGQLLSRLSTRYSLAIMVMAFMSLIMNTVNVDVVFVFPCRIYS